MIPILSPDPESPFPPTDKALDSPNGLLAAGGDLSPTRLIRAYRDGIFPWYSDNQPILWWSPAPRCVIYPQQIHIARRLKRRFNQGLFTLTADQAFEQVIGHCAAPRQTDNETWITAEMQAAYLRLFKLGVAHSVEAWVDGELAGGVYGLALGAVFFGESMFSKVTDASKIALVALCQQLHRWRFTLMDCQIVNPHLTSMGAQDIPRSLFQSHLKGAALAGCWGSDFRCDPCW